MWSIAFGTEYSNISTFIKYSYQPTNKIYHAFVLEVRSPTLFKLPDFFSFEKLVELFNLFEVLLLSSFPKVFSFFLFFTFGKRTLGFFPSCISSNRTSSSLFLSLLLIVFLLLIFWEVYLNLVYVLFIPLIFCTIFLFYCEMRLELELMDFKLLLLFSLFMLFSFSRTLKVELGFA